MTDEMRITYQQLATWKAAIKLEALGMRHSSGRSVKAHACRALGLAARAPHATVIGVIEQMMAEILKAAQGVVLGDKDAPHVFDVECTKGGVKLHAEVHAVDRSQASRLATQHGYEVMSVNMVG